jgi:hypothetical protein
VVWWEQYIIISQKDLETHHLQPTHPPKNIVFKIGAVNFNTIYNTSYQACTNPGHQGFMVPRTVCILYVFWLLVFGDNY